jgi:hypothetical protein
MLIYDLEGEAKIGYEAELINRLHTIKRGEYGAFMLSHAKDAASLKDGPYLCVHTKGDLGYVHFFKGGEESHAGFQPATHAPVINDSVVRFLQTDGKEANAIAIPAAIAISADLARQAAVEFFRAPELPPSIAWFEL